MKGPDTVTQHPEANRDQKKPGSCSSDCERQPGNARRANSKLMRYPETLYIEPTNRCNLRCTTCPRTFFKQEVEKDMTMEEFRHVLAEIPGASRIVLHGLGEPLLHPSIVQMVKEAAARGGKVLFNTNGMLLNRERSISLINAGLSELRVSIDMPDPEQYKKIRPGGDLQKVYDNVAVFLEERRKRGRETPAVSFWMTEGRNRIGHLAQLVRDAARLGVAEVYLQRLIVLGRGDATNDNAVFRRHDPAIIEALAEAERVAAELGVTLWGSGNVNPASRATDDFMPATPWGKCRRPFTATYITANGNVLPCCLAPFTAAAEINRCILGNVFTTPFPEIWNGPSYAAFRRAFESTSPPLPCKNCGTLWSL